MAQIVPMSSPLEDDPVTNTAAKIALGFENINVTRESPTKKAILSNVSGYVKCGGITAVMGASASGKSVLLQALSGRIQDMSVGGKVWMDGKAVNPRDPNNPIALVPQGDSVIGDLTAREVTTQTALFKRNEPREQIDQDVNELLEKLGLTKVADGIIGTLIFRGLSGGQKKRVEIANELIASPSILLLDEPTSGLDSSIAYEVISCLRDLTRTSKCHLSIILTIHQPNSRLLELFDHLLLLEQGSCLFFGTLEESFPYFTSLGYTCPPTVTATDYFLQISDTNFASKDDGQFDFVGAWPTTNEAKELQAVLSKHDQLCQSGLLPKPENPATAHGPVPFWKKVGILVWRDYTIAYRDPTLYYFQAMMLMSFAFLTGAVFWKLPKEINGNFNIFPAGLLWIVFFHTWVHAFKVFHLSSSDKRAQHEIYNQKYTPLAVIIADTISVSTLAVVFFGVPPIAYFMMGYPSEGFPFIILASWLACISGEAMIALITKFSQDPTTAMVFCQIALVSLQVFGGGVFLPWRDCPTYWMWLQEMTVFAQATRTMNMEVFRYLDLKCLLAPDGKCYDPSTGAHYRCDSYYSDGIYCTVNGREVLAVTQGIGRDQDYWWYFGYLCAIYVCFKIAIGFFTFFPWYRVQYWLTQTFIPPTKLAPTQEAFEPVPPSSPRGARGGGGDLEEGIPSPEMPSSRKSSFHEPNQFMGLAWSKFNVILPQSGVKLVDNVCGHVPSGHILALMGPSGAGKTTLLNGLARRAPYAKLTGSVRFGGREMNSQDLTYIPQFDEVNDVLTVWEHIHLVGLLTCEDHVVMTTRAEELLMVLGLTKKRDIQVRHLSSGELKRLSVGIGLISNPFVLFLDEPTTGLDSTAAYSIVSYLAIVAKATQVAVIMTLHQPSSLVFDMIDDLFLLESGKVVYSGPIRKASPYFASIGFDNPNRINPADYYLDLALKPPSNEETWPALFQKSPYAAQYFDQTFKYASYNLPIQSPPYPSFASRFQTMLHHFSRYLLIEPGYLVYRLFALIATGIFLGTLFLQLETKTNQLNSYSGAMFSAAIAVMLTAISATGLYARDRREAVDRIKNGFYSPGLYVLTQFMVSAFYNWFLAFVFTCIFHWLTNINPNKISFIYDIFISWGHILLMESALLLFVEILKNDFLATTSGMIFIGCCMLFAGFFRQVSEIPASISWMCFAIPFRWSIDGFTWQIFYTQTFDISGTDMKIDGPQLLQEVFHKYDIHSWGMFGALIGYVFFFRFIQYVLFAYQTGVWKTVSKEAAPLTQSCGEQSLVIPLVEAPH